MVGTSTKFDTVLDVCEHAHRRAVLAALAETPQTVSVDDLANAIVEHNHDGPVVDVSDGTLTQIRIGLHHVHLPKLDEAGFIEYDPEHHLVEPTAQFDGGESHLLAVLDADSELVKPLDTDLVQETHSSYTTTTTQ